MIPKTTSTSANYKINWREKSLEFDEANTQSRNYKFDESVKYKNKYGEGSVGIKGSADLSLTVSVKCYVKVGGEKYVELKADYKLYASLDITGALEQKIPICELDFMPVSGVIVHFQPLLVIKLDAKIHAEITVTGCVGLSASSTNGLQNISTGPKVEAGAKFDGSIYVGLELEPEIHIIDEDLAKVSLKAELGIEATAKWGIGQYAPTPSDDVIHECKSCVDGDINAKWSLTISARLLDDDDLTWTKNLLNKSYKIADFYSSDDYLEFGFGECPHKSYKVTVNVVNLVNASIEDASVVCNGQVYKTDKDGKVSMYLSGNSYELSVSKTEYSPSNSKITVSNQPKKVTVTLFKAGEVIGSGSGSGTGTGEGGNSGYGYDDGGLGAIAASMSDTPIKDVQIYNGRTAVITKNGTLYMFGAYLFGAGTYLVTDSGEISGKETPVKIFSNVKSVSLGYTHTAILTNSGDLYLWGTNDYGQIGDGTTVGGTSPVKIMSGVKNIALNDYSSYAVMNNGDLYAWGENQIGQLGDGTTNNSLVPKKIMKNILSVNAAHGMVAAITTSGDLYTWGYNNYGQLGIGNLNSNVSFYTIPVKILSNVKNVAMNRYNWSESYTVAAITNLNELYVWGCNSYGKVGNGTKSTVFIPTKIMDNIRSVSLGESHTTAITNSNELYVWGLNSSGQLGTGNYKENLSPVKIMDNIKSVAAGYRYTVVLNNIGDVYTFGDNGVGNLGNNGVTGNGAWCVTPQKVMLNCAKIYVGGSSTAAVTYDNGVIDGYLYMWGGNGYGQIGNGTTNNQNVPLRVSLNNSKTTSTSATIKTTTKLTKDYEDLEPYGVYNFYVMRSRTEYEPLNSENLYYITQGVADEEGRLSFTYAPTENYETADRFVTAMDRISIANAGAEISDMLYNGETQYAEPIIMLDDLQLVEGRDYELSGDFAAKDAGEYTLTVTGIGKYTGTLTLTYNMIMEFLNLSEIDKDSIIIGEEININASAVGGDGNYTYTYYFRNVSDPYWSVLDMDSTETTMTFEPYKVGQYYARVDVKDGTGTVKRKAMTFEVLSKSLVNLSTISSNKIFTGSSVKLSGAAQGGQAPYRYAVYYKNVFDNKWKTAQSFDSNSIINLNFNAEGMYDVCIKVKDAYNSISKLYFAVTVENEKFLPLKNNSSISSTSVKLGGKLNVTAKAEGGKGKYTYAFYYKQANKTAWTTLQNFAENTTVEIEPDTETVYDVCAKVKDESGTVVKKYFTFNVISPELVNTSKVLAESILQGATVKISATGRGGTAPYTFAVYTKLKDKTSWTTTQDFNKNSTISFKPAAAGEYDICVKVKDSEGEVVNKYFTLKVELNELKDLSTLSADKVVVGEEVTVHAAAKGGIGSYTYGVYYKQTSQSKWTTAQDFSTNSVVTLKPSTATTYDICVKIKDEEGTLIKTYFKITVTQPELENTSTISSENIKLGDSVTITSSAKYGSGSYTYGVYYKQTSQSKWTTAQDFSSNKVVSLKPAKTTTYDVCVKVKDSQGTVAKTYFIVTVIPDT